jgi:hypothetical protein
MKYLYLIILGYISLGIFGLLASYFGYTKKAMDKLNAKK